jgi:hypothetical protein
MDNISLDQVLKQMERVDRAGKPVPFTITTVTCDLERKKGGERISCSAVLHGAGGKRRAYHDRNDTRNIRRTNQEIPFSIHPLLITKLNGRTVFI